MRPVLFLFLIAALFRPGLLGAQPATNGAPDNPSSLAAPITASPNTPLAAPAAATGAAPQEEIADIRPPFFFLHSWVWLWYALAAAALLAVFIALWKWLKPARFLTPKTAYELALEKLEKARGLLREDEAMPYTLAVSETIRTYLGQRFQAPSSRQTTEEFLRQMATDDSTPLAGHRDLLQNFLTSCDLVKFAKYRPHVEELEEVHQRAYSFVTATKPEPLPGNGAKP